MRRVLFVDDEVHELQTLRGELETSRQDWTLEFAPGPEAALAASVAHAFLRKPCDAAEVTAAIERACALQEALDDEALRRAINRAGKLPSAPRLYFELVRLLDEPDTGAADVAEVIRADVAMSAKVLQLINSAFFALRREIATVREAVTMLGFDTVKALVLGAEAFERFELPPGAGGLDVEALNAHSLRVAALAGKIADPAHAQTAYVAGVLHDVGKLLLAKSEPRQLTGALAEAEASGRALWVVEDELRQTTHAEVGAYLLALWSLPYPVVEAVAHHHRPERLPMGSFDAVAAVHVADALVNEATRAGAAGELDAESVARWGVEDRLAEWRRMAAESARG